MTDYREPIARAIWENISQLAGDYREVHFEQILIRPRHSWMKGILFHAADRVLKVGFELAIERIRSVPIFIDPDGKDPDAQREASSVKADAIEALQVDKAFEGHQ